MNQAAAQTAEHAPVTGSELFALTDEQILDIQPDTPDASSVAQPLLAVQGESNSTASTTPGISSPTDHGPRTTDHAAPAASHESQVTSLPAVASHASSSEPPPWLAAQMADPHSGAEARDLWNGVQQARNEAAAYREVFAKPEDARAASDRARALEEIDAAFFGGAGKSADEVSAGRAALAQRMLREDPAAFREMVFAGLRALEFPVGARHAVPAAVPAATSPNVGADFSPSPSPSAASAQRDAALDAQLAAYRGFEQSANEDLERSVGAAIRNSLEQALPVAQPLLAVHSGSPQGRPLHDRLAAAVRDDVESALKSDQQLGEQLARVLSARRFDEATRSQVVRLINNRAQQLVPVAARRVIRDWTQTALAAYRGVAPGGPAPFAGSSAHHAEESPASPRSLTNSSAASRGASTRAPTPAVTAKAAAADRAERDGGFTSRATTRSNGRPVDYSRLSDEQILEL